MTSKEILSVVKQSNKDIYDGVQGFLDVIATMEKKSKLSVQMYKLSAESLNKIYDATNALVNALYSTIYKDWEKVVEAFKTEEGDNL